MIYQVKREVSPPSFSLAVFICMHAFVSLKNFFIPWCCISIICMKSPSCYFASCCNAYFKLLVMLFCFYCKGEMSFNLKVYQKLKCFFRSWNSKMAVTCDCSLMVFFKKNYRCYGHTAIPNSNYKGINKKLELWRGILKKKGFRLI